MSDSPSFDLRAQVKMLAEAVENGTLRGNVRKKTYDTIEMRVERSRRADGRLRRDHWAIVREYIMRRDGRACCICGMNDPDVLDVHHIVAVHEGGSDVKTNLLVLCANHHRLAQRGKISPDELRKAIVE